MMIVLAVQWQMFYTVSQHAQRAECNAVYQLHLSLHRVVMLYLNTHFTIW